MPYKAPLCHGLRRVLPSHRSALGARLRRDYLGIVRSLNLGDDRLLLLAANRCAVLMLRADVATQEWAALVEKRRAGRGKPPSRKVVERARRVAALEDRSAAAALDKLHERAGNHQPSVAELLRRARGEDEEGARG